MVERSRCVAHWGSKRQPAEELGRQWAGFIADIGELHPALSQWFTEGNREYHFDKLVRTEPATLTARLEAGRSWTDTTNEQPQRYVIEELGYRDSLVNNPQLDVSMELQASVFNVPRLPTNWCYLEFRDPAEEPAGIYNDPDLALKLVECQIKHWNPDAVAWDNYPWLLLQKPIDFRPVVGWFNYFKGIHLTDTPVGEIIPHPKGTIIRTAPRYEDITDDMITTLHHHLLTTGTLKPIR